MKLKSILLAGAVAITAALPAGAQDLGLSRINATVPFGEGGGSDTLVRAVAPYLSSAFANEPTILVRNEPGGGGIPASNRFAKRANPDGSDFLAMSSSIFIANTLGAKQIDFTMDDFVPVFIAPMAPLYYVSPSTGATETGDVAGIKGASLVFGGGRQDSADILTVLSFDLLGFDVKSVWGLERGGGRIGFERGEFNVDHQTTAAYLRSVQPLVDEGKAVTLMAGGVIAPSGEIVRDPNFPDVPTFIELYEEVHGAPLSGPAYEAYYALTSAAITVGKAIVLPSAAPSEVVGAYSAAFEKVIANPEFRAANEKALGGYELYTGADAQALCGTVTGMSPEARAWLADWYAETVGFSLAQ
ncbi:tricarboxylate transporter [Litorisediminicola beolgyonensis]|uniref:Tricarboxylate transporter n=1 Tax=Litorisediminicola beolgyonensis TaxID=1173614 RepID=A0ABW3ZJA5_9RHOB